MAVIAPEDGVFMPGIGWGWALLIWGYALAWFLINDRVKLAAYKIFDQRHSGFLIKTREQARRPA